MRKELKVARENNIMDLDNSQILDILINHLKEEHNFSNSDINRLIGKPGATIPVSIFSDRLSSLEAIVKYLFEEHHLTNRQIADLLNRNIRTIWATYRNAVKKLPKPFTLTKTRFKIPASLLKNRTFSTLEAIVMYLKENYNLNFHEIALLLKRDDSTIWTVYHRALKKQNG